MKRSADDRKNHSANVEKLCLFRGLSRFASFQLWVVCDMGVDILLSRFVLLGVSTLARPSLCRRASYLAGRL